MVDLPFLPHQQLRQKDVERPMRTRDASNEAGGGISGCVHPINRLEDSIRFYLEELYTRIAGGNAQIQLNQAHLDHFLRTEQGSLDPVPQWILEKPAVSFTDFMQLMCSPYSNMIAPMRDEDLNHPLPSYFICSSHNTYLSGNQLSSKCTASAFTNVLKRGCRCVEMDVWDTTTSDFGSSSDEEQRTDVKSKRSSTLSSLKVKLKRLGGSTKTNEEDPGQPPTTKTKHRTAVDDLLESKFPHPVGVLEPKVYHGYTMTKPVTFRKACVAVLLDAFTVTDLPLVVSLETHCSPEQQERMVAIMQEVFAGYLVEQPLTPLTELPSPASLRNKILIKVKYAQKVVDSDGDVGLDEEYDEQDNPTPVTAPGMTTKQEKKKASKIINALSDMGVYMRGVSFKSFEAVESQLAAHIYAIGEKKIASLDPVKLWEHNKRYFMRVYPGGSRIMSSNFDPVAFWNKGVQIVALNWQEWDQGMMLNEAMFAGSQGWVLKPKGFRPEDQGPPITHTLDLKITVFAAQNLPLPNTDDTVKGFQPYVKCGLHYETPYGALTTDDKLQSGMDVKERTTAMRGVHPDFGGQELVFKAIPGIVEQLTFVRFVVRDKEFGTDDLSTWACVRLDHLQQGYRFVHLFNPRGEMSPNALLFVKVEKKLH